MNKIFVGLFFFYFLSGYTSLVVGNGTSDGCLFCDNFVLCELKNGLRPRCKTDAPCTQEQLKSCEDLFLKDANWLCDRPGIFADSKSPSSFYKCLMASNSGKFFEEKTKCEEGSTFDQKALLCLTEEEKHIAKEFKEYSHVREKECPSASCKKPGIYGCLRDCKKFYHCDDAGKMTTFNCPLGSYYSFDDNKCVKTLTPNCRNQLSRIAMNERLRALSLLSKIKQQSKKNVPPGLCMRFCENNWQVITENNPEVFKNPADVTSNVTYKISPDLLDKYEDTAIKLKALIDKISEQEQEEEDKYLKEEYEEPNYDNHHRPGTLRSFFLRLIIKALWNLIRNVGSYLRQYIRENVCYRVEFLPPFPPMPTTPILISTTESSVTSFKPTKPIDTTTQAASSSTTPYKGTDSTPEVNTFTSITSVPHTDTTQTGKSDVTTAKEPTFDSTPTQTTESTTTADIKTITKPVNESPYCSVPQFADGNKFLSFAEVDSSSEGKPAPLPPASKPVGYRPHSNPNEPDEFYDSFGEADGPDEEEMYDSDETDPDSEKLVPDKWKSFKCHRVGFFRDPENCHKYYRCVRTRSKWMPHRLVAKHYTCKDGKYFAMHGNIWKCVKAKPSNCP